jgi:hypothetical protein
MASRRKVNGHLKSRVGAPISRGEETAAAGFPRRQGKME